MTSKPSKPNPSRQAQLICCLVRSLVFDGVPLGSWSTLSGMDVRSGLLVEGFPTADRKVGSGFAVLACLV